MYKLISKMLKAGASKGGMEAKVFGGGHQLKFFNNSNTLPSENIITAKTFLEMEDIPITQIDVGGEYTRNVIMEVISGRVYLKKTIMTYDLS